MKTLKEYREDKGVKITAIAKHLGISRQTYRKYENNQEMMSVEQAKSTCEFLGCSPSEIFFGLKGK